MNFRLTLAYDGTDFHGWQTQAGVQTSVRTVQGELARVLGLLERRRVIVNGAGRTDAGVHAEAQTASVQLERDLPIDKLHKAINGNLPTDVRVARIEEMPDDFHARFSATGKTYRYRIFNAVAVSPFLRRYALHEARPLDVDRMRDAARLFVGTHDWTRFSCAQSDVASRVRTVRDVDVRSTAHETFGGQLIDITAHGEGFLRYMVRGIAGALLAVGRGAIGEDEIRAALAGERRAGATAPPNGLTLVKVHYDLNAAGCEKRDTPIR